MAPKPLPPEYPRELHSLSDHLRTARLKRGLLQKEVAERLGVTTMTVNAWETGRDEPKVSYLPRIYAFLGYFPPAETQSFAERLREKRRRRGLTQAKLAHQLGLGTCTLQMLEAGGQTRDKRVLTAVAAFLEAE